MGLQSRLREEQIARRDGYWVHPNKRPLCSNLDCPLASTLFSPNVGLCAYCYERSKR